jgi:hypothetical protein
MSNYPDGLSEGTPGAPWNQEPVRCSKCRDDLDQDASEQGDDNDPGWPGGLCSSCADDRNREMGCDCDVVFCCPEHRDEYEEEGRRIEEEVRNNPATHVTAADKLAASDPVLFHRLCEDNPERLP